MDRNIPLIFIVFISVLALSSGQCPDDYMEGPNGRCYGYYDVTLGTGWAYARGYCAATNDSDLVILDDQIEYEWAVNLTSTIAPNSSWWIGYHDGSVEGDWRWIDCGETTEWHRTLWSPGNPGNGREDCGVLLPTGKIDDIVCDTPINYILCEVSPKGFTPDEASPTNLIANVTSTLTVSLTWDVSPFNCDVFAYKIRTTDEQMETTQVIVYGGDTSNVDILVDRVRSEYSFTVAAWTINDGELPQTDPVMALTGPCPDDFEESPAGRCYYFRSLTNGEWWPAGRRSCDDIEDGDLVVINDEEEWNYIKNRTSEIDPDGRWWIGLSDLASDNDWLWTDCSESNDWQNSLWAPGYPTSDDTKDCAILYPDGLIQDDVCDLRINSICEISPKEFDGDALLVDNLMVTGSSTTSLHITWSLPTYGCDAVGYRIYYSMMDTMEDKDFMFVSGGDVTDAIIQDLRANTTYYVSVAIYINKDSELQESLAVEGTTMACPVNYEEGPNGHCYWFAYPMTYRYMWHWSRQDCMEEPDSDLVIIDDEEELDFLCNRTTELSADRDWWIGLSGSPDWTWIDCEEPNSWQDTLWAPGNPQPGSYGCGLFNDETGEVSDVACDAKHYFICEIYPKDFSAEDQNVQDIEASPLMYGMNVNWTPAPTRCDVDGYKISYKEDVEGARESFVIQYGEDSTSTAVTGLYPNRTYNVTVAAFLNTDTELSPVGPVQITTLACPVNYEEGPNGHCYWFAYPMTYRYMWHWSRQDCMEEPDSDLVIIDDEEELDFLRNRTAELSADRDWWIGLSGSPDWTWIDCEEPNSWQDTLWAPGNPQPGSYGCGLFNDETGEVLDVACDAKHYFICEIYPKGFSAEDQNVQDIEASPLMYGMNVSWTPAPTRCDVDGYKISYKEDVEGARESFVIQYGEDSTSTTVTGLYPNRTYNVTVAAFLNTDTELSPVGPAQITTPSCPDNYEEGPNGHCYRFRILDNGTRWMRGRQTCDNVEDSDYVIIDDEEELNYLLNRSAEVDPDMTWWIGLSDLSMPGSYGWVDCSGLTPWQAGLWAPSYPTGQPSRCAALQPDGGVVDLPCQTRLSYLCELLPKGFDSDAIVVENVTAQGYSNYINVNWIQPENNCDAIGYVIYSQLSDGTGERKSVYVNGGESTSGAARSLTLGTSYSITVAISTSKEMELEETEPITATTASSCPDNYEAGPNGHCYRFWLEDYGNWWTTSRQDCVLDKDYSDLLVINDQEEYDFVMNRTMELSANDSWWIGLTDQSVEGDYRWIDCQASDAFQDSLWAPGYPSNTAHDCALLQPTGEVIDLLCDDRLRGFVCEIAPREFDWEEAKVQSLLATGIASGLEVTWTVSSRSCDVIGYRVTYQLDEQGSQSDFMIVYGGDVEGVTISGLFPERRYVIGVTAILNFDATLSPVTTVGTTLTCPNNYEEGPNGHCYRFRILDDGSHWPTGRRTCDNVENSDLAIINDPEELAFLVNRSAEINPSMTWWIGLSDLYVEGEWRWVDCTTTTPYQESLWAPHYPSDSGLTCAALQPSGDIINLPCDRRFSYLCELYPKGFDLDSQVVENVRASGGMYTIDVTWDLPDNGCNAVGYKIYYELTGVESDVLRSVFVSGGDSVSGSVTDLNANTSYDVTVVIITSKDIELGATEPVTVSTVTCPNNYEEGPNGHCYRFRILDDGSHWPTGRRTCDNVENSDLAIINDPEELAFLVNRSAEINPSMTWWIGLSDLYIEGEWRWVDCTTTTPYQESLWAPDYPSDSGLTCAALQPSGDIINLPCDRRFSYLCELYPKGFDLDSQVVENVRASGGMYTIDVTWDLPDNGCNAVGYKIYYELTGVESDVLRSVFVSGGDSVSGSVTGLNANTSYDVTVVIITSKDIELGATEPVTVSTAACPDDYEAGPNGHCYRFRLLDIGSWWSTGRRVCDNEVDSDLVIISDEIEFDYLMNRTGEIDPTMNWWIGYTDQSIEGDWRWIDCQASNTFQRTLWAPGYPGNGIHDCAALRPSGDIADLVCDATLSYICEISPKGFGFDDINPHDLAATGVTYGLEVTWTPSATSCDVIGYRITYQLDEPGSSDEFVIVYGGDTRTATVDGLLPGRTYNVSVAAILNQDYELLPIDPVNATTLPCPDFYEEGPNGRCYRFRILEYGSWWPTGRRTCDDELDSDLAIINDQVELDFLLNRTAEIDPTIMWWIGYSDQSVEGDWRWIDCTESSSWQNELWVPGHPGNGRLDCAALQPNGQIVDLVCDTPLSYLCEVSPRGFSQEDASPSDLAVMGTTYGVEVTWTVSPTSCDVVGYRISYYLTGDISTRASTFIYGGDVSSAVVRGLAVNTTYDVTVAAFISKDIELTPVGPVTATTDPCPDGYSLAPNGRCYLFVQDTYGSFWHYSRETCWDQKDSDLAIINDQDELDYITQQITNIGDTKDWWIGYSDNSVEGEWKWVDCTDSDEWQMNLWAPGSPDNEMPDCGSLSSSGEVEAEVCDRRLNFVCEVSPKGFDPTELKVDNLEASGASYGVDVSWSLPENNCDTVAYKIYYQEMNNEREQFQIIYGGDSVGARIQGLLPNTTLNVSVAVVIVDEELERVGPIIGQSDPCPSGYEEAANGRCYWFQDFGRYGNDWDDTRFYCSEAGEKFDHDLMIIDDEWELEYITNRTKEFNDSRDWRIGYSDLAEEGVWKWVTCESPDQWQESLWAPGYPQNGRDDCGVFDPDTMTIYDQVCDVMNINYICEVTPKDFSIGDDNVFNLNATAINWDTIRVTWNVSEYNCDVIAYNIYYLDTFMGGRPMRALVYGGEIDSYDLTMLQPSTRYSISVSAERTDLELPQVDPVYVTTPEGPCPAYYEIGPNGGCYRFITSQYGSMWADGRSGCERSDPDSDLVVIDDQMELDFIVNRTKEFDSLRDWWIGFSDFSVETDWRWVTCDAPTDWQNTLWDTGYPRNGLHDCGALSSGSRRVIDAVCDDKNYYICKLTPKGFTNADMNVYKVMSSPMSSSEVHVTWMLSNITCNVYGYKIYYGIQGEPFDVTQFHIAYGGNVTSKTVPGLSPSMTYEFHVAALIPDRLELPMVGPTNATTYSECGRTIVDSDGMIMNADYPNGYYGPETCEWLVSAPMNQYVLLQILDFDTHVGNDLVVIGSGMDFASETTLYVLSGSKANAGSKPIPDKILGPEQHLWISFRTSESTLDYAGFQMAVTMVTQGPGTPERQYDDIYEEGTLSSPGWPDQYPNFTDITWTLIAPKTGRARITSLEGSLETNYDTLTIGYGNPDSSVLNSYTGEFKLTETLESPTYNFWVRFQADETVSDKGFTLYWESFDDQDSCGTQELLEGSGSIMSPNFPEPYPDNQECTWFIRLPSMDHLVRVEFTAFSLETDHDFLIIGSGKTVNEEVIVILTGDSLPDPVESTSYRMWLQFKSDESFSDSGFFLEYTSIENPEPPTQYNEITDTVIFIVQDEPIGWFTPVRQEDLANAIAMSMTDYCQDKSDTCEVITSMRRRRDAGIQQLAFSEEDVEFLDTEAVENNLHITTWVRNPSMVGEDVVKGIEPEIVQTSLMEETSQTIIRDIMGEGFEYSVAPNVQNPTEEPGGTEPPVEGLEPWAIALIVVGSFAVIMTAVVGLEIRHRRKMKEKVSGNGVIAGSEEYLSDGGEVPDYAVPVKGSSKSTTFSQEFQNDGFDDGENTRF